MKKWNYNEDLEKTLTAVFGFVGITAIIVNLTIKGYTSENIFDAIKDISSLIIAIAVFLVANKIFRRKKKMDFNQKFEALLAEWVSQNKYLIDPTIREEGKKEHKRIYNMVLDHTLLVETNVLATQQRSAAFLYLPQTKKSEKISDEVFKRKQQLIQFKINESNFSHRKDFDYEKEKKRILDSIAGRINSEFGQYGFVATRSGEPEKIDVDFSGIERDEENARRLVALVEFVKTMVLAIA